MKRDGLYSGRRFRGAVRAFMLGRAAQGIANLALTLWVVRLLAPADYGAYMALWGMVEMLVPLSSLGLLEAVRRFLPDLATRGSARGVRAFVKWTTLARFAILLAWAGLIAWAWAAVSGWIGLDAGQAGQAWPVVFLIVTVLAFRYACEMLECLLEQRWSQLAHALHPVGRLSGVAGLVFAGQISLATVLWLDVAVSAVCLALAEWALARKLRGLGGGGDFVITGREVLVFSWHMAGVNVLQSLASLGAQRLLAARLLGLEAAGLFSFLQQLLLIVSRYMPAQLLANVIRPMLISRFAAGEARVVSEGIALMWKSNLLIVLGCVAVLLAAGNELVAIASGGRFTDAGWVTLILFVGLGATSQSQLVNLAMQIHDRTRTLRNQSALFLMVPLAAWLGATKGLVGMVAGIVLAQWLRNSFGLWWMRRQGIGIALDTMGAFRLVVLTVLAAVLAWWCDALLGPWPALGLALAILVLGLFVAKPLNGADYDLLRRASKGKARFLKPLVWDAL